MRKMDVNEKGSIYFFSYKYTFSYSRVRKKDINIDNRKRNTIYF